MIPDLILGAGPSGLMLANRLKELGRPFLVLERGPEPMQKTGDGFFYLHEPITGLEEKIDIIVTVCPGKVDESAYAAKVYGDPQVRPVSIKTQDGKHVGYKFQPIALLAPVEEQVVCNVEVAFVDTVNHLVFTKKGQSWPYARLHSTIPLPIFSKMMPRGPAVKFHSRPIFIQNLPRARVEAALQPEKGEMRCHYCPGECHDWYRATVHGHKAQFERMSSATYTSYPLHPGKIWLDPADREHEHEELSQYRFYLEAKDIFLWGRYAEWKPKHLLHNVWQALKDRIK